MDWPISIPKWRFLTSKENYLQKRGGEVAYKDQSISLSISLLVHQSVSPSVCLSIWHCLSKACFHCSSLTHTLYTGWQRVCTELNQVLRYKDKVIPDLCVNPCTDHWPNLAHASPSFKVKDDGHCRFLLNPVFGHYFSFLHQILLILIY